MSTSVPPDKGKVVRTLNWLLRGENSATETYGLAIPRVAGAGSSDLEVLRSIVREHDAARDRIREAIRRVGGIPDESSGAWPAFVKTVDGPAKVFGDAAALKALKEGEEHGLRDYRNALEQLNEETGKLIESLIPEKEKHIDALEALIARL